MKIFFFTNIIAPYRIGLYNKLNEYLKGDIKFYFDRKNETNRKWSINEDDLDFNYKIKKSLFYKKVSKATNDSKLHRFIYFPFYIFSVVLRERPKIILSNEFGLRTLFTLISGKLVRAKIIVLSEVTELTERNISTLKIKFRKFLSKHLDGGIAHGKQSFNYLLQLGFSKQSLTISPNSIDNSYFENLSNKISKEEARRELRLPEQKFIFLYVGQFIQRKGLDLLVSSIKKNSKEIEFKNVIFVFVGGSKQEMEKVADKNISKCIKIFNFKDTKDLSYFYKAADCFIFPTRNDVWGLVVNEAVACNLSVAVSKYAGCADDLIENNISGIVFDPLDEKSFFDTIKFCIDNPSKLNQYKINAKKKLKIFNHDIAASRIVDFVSQI